MSTAHDVVVAMAEAQEARDELTKCYASCDHSAGWHCFSYSVRVDAANKALEHALNSLIDARVRVALSAIDEPKEGGSK